MIYLCMCICVSVHSPCGASVPVHQWILDVLKLELKGIVSCLMWVQKLSLDHQKEQEVLFTTKSSL